MLARSPERREAVPEENPLPGSSKATAQKKRSELIKTRALLRRTITNYYGKLMEVINREGSRTFLERMMGEYEIVWQKCKKIDMLIKEILDEEDNEEAGNKKEVARFEYEEKFDELREASKIYLERRRMELLSVAGSAAGSVIDPDEHIEGRENTDEEENRRKMDPLQPHLGNGNRTQF